MFSVHQLSLKSVEEKCENTAECCLQKTKKKTTTTKTKKQQQQQKQKNKTNKKKQRSGRFTRIKTWL